MIVETIQHGAIPYMCEHCKSMYLWTPSEEDEDGVCRIKSGEPKCEMTDCEYYTLDPEVRCPFCKNKYEQKRISAFRYKIARGLKGAKQK